MQGQLWSFSGLQLILPPALNLPVAFVQLPYIIANPDKTEWVPGGLSFEVWRAVSWPFAGLVFWWLAGRGLEALDAALRQHTVNPKIAWAEGVAGLALFGCGGITFLGMVIGELRTDQLSMAMAAGGGLWMILGAVTIAARILQWRIRRKSKEVPVMCQPNCI